MKKILLFSFFLMLGLVVSQFLPAMVGEGYSSVKTVSNTLLYVCLDDPLTSRDADRKSTRLNSSHTDSSRMPSSA